MSPALTGPEGLKVAFELIRRMTCGLADTMAASLFQNDLCRQTPVAASLFQNDLKLRLHWGEALTSSSSEHHAQQGYLSTQPPSSNTCIHSALILRDNEVPFKEDKLNALLKAAGVNVEPFWPGLFAMALANVNIGSLICNVGAGGPAPAAAVAPAGAPGPSTAAAPAEEEEVEAKKEECEESDDDLGFGLFD
ncbi:60S acidic ribosomal protein P1-like [Nycticebus coucang]|uniref:60S acidic ribosomal protein P1-like n=1 Tax=Nycticebus coucang TaxID=9470 RepID=UPI00234E36AB|nr:60S acidic ribosomal protein P1-like [Nycticebus coucang]